MNDVNFTSYADDENTPCDIGVVKSKSLQVSFDDKW